MRCCCCCFLDFAHESARIKSYKKSARRPCRFFFLRIVRSRPHVKAALYSSQDRYVDVKQPLETIHRLSTLWVSFHRAFPVGVVRWLWSNTTVPRRKAAQSFASKKKRTLKPTKRIFVLSDGIATPAFHSQLAVLAEKPGG